MISVIFRPPAAPLNSYDEPPARPYHYANAWGGLRLRAGPSLGSTIISTIPYGESLAFTGVQRSRLGTVAGLAGKWVHVGSDLGRGWVFDAMILPVPVFQQGQTFDDYVDKCLVFKDSITYTYDVSKEMNKQFTLYFDHLGNQYLHHSDWDGDWLELQFNNLTEAQALITAKNLLRANGYDEELLWQFGTTPVLNLTSQNLRINSKQRINWLEFRQGVLIAAQPID
ncbi:MAG: SH3 domain-containing protein [Bacteroidota bacterium]